MTPWRRARSSVRRQGTTLAISAAPKARSGDSTPGGTADRSCAGRAGPPRDREGRPTRWAGVWTLWTRSSSTPMLFARRLIPGVFQHELRHDTQDVRTERPCLVLDQIVDDVLRINADRQWRDLCVDQLPAHAQRGEHVSNLPGRHMRPGMVVEILHLLLRASRANTPAPAPCGTGNDRRHPAQAVSRRRHTPSRSPGDSPGPSGTCARADVPSDSCQAAPE